MDKYALLVRMNPKHWPIWERYIQPNKESHAWFKIGRRIHDEIQAGLPVVILGTNNMGVLAVGETATCTVFCSDPGWEEVAPERQAECKEARNRVQILMHGLSSPIPIVKIQFNSTIASLPKIARETVTWLKSDEYNAFMTLIHDQ